MSLPKVKPVVGGGNLARAASAVLRAQRCVGQACEEIQAYHAPSECIDLVYRGIRRGLVRELSALGFTVDSYDAAVEARLGSRYCYHRGLSASSL
jgi:hypothetical protein